MSQWYEPQKEDMNLSDDGKELQVCFDSDYQGNIWISLKVEDILEELGLKRDSEKKQKSC